MKVKREAKEKRETDESEVVKMSICQVRVAKMRAVMSTMHLTSMK